MTIIYEYNMVVLLHVTSIYNIIVSYYSTIAITLYNTTIIVDIIIALSYYYSNTITMAIL